MDYYLPITNPDVIAASDMWYRQSGDMDYLAIPSNSWWIGLTVKKLSKDFGGITFYNKIEIPNVPNGFTILENSDDDYVFKTGDRYFRSGGMSWGNVTAWNGSRVKRIKEINNHEYIIVAKPNKTSLLKKKYPPIPDGYVLLDEDTALEYTFKAGDYFTYHELGKWEKVNQWGGETVKDKVAFRKDFHVAVLDENIIKAKQKEYLELTAPEYKLESNIEYFYTMDGEPKFHKLNGYSGRNLKRVLSENDNRIKVYIRKPRFDNPRPYPHGY